MDQHMGRIASESPPNKKRWHILVLLLIFSGISALFLATPPTIDESPKTPPLVTTPPSIPQTAQEIKPVPVVGLPPTEVKTVEPAPVVKAVEKPRVITAPIAPQEKVVAVKVLAPPPQPSPVETIEQEPVGVTTPPPGAPAEEEPQEGEIQYIKLDADGNRLPDDAESWVCVEDPRTGLVWEVKTEDGGLRDKNSLFSWYQPTLSGVLQGVADKGRCEGKIDCDADAYIKAINSEAYCGYADWRLPTREEMLSVVSFSSEDGGNKVLMNSDYFPQTLPSWYWTASSNEGHPDYAWYVLFRNGIALSDRKARPKHLRLVRSGNVGDG